MDDDLERDVVRGAFIVIVLIIIARLIHFYISTVLDTGSKPDAESIIDAGGLAAVILALIGLITIVIKQSHRDD